MAYVITQACCNDASCVSVCPVNCIHPTPDEAPFMRTEMLYIDPEACIDCSQCVYACPVDAIRSEDDLDDETMPYLEINAAYYEKHPIELGTPLKRPAKKNFDYTTLRVAIVGSGPAASYAAIELLGHRGVQVNMFERLLTPYGLVRFGVAPDHPGTKAVTEVFQLLGDEPGFRLNLGIEVGKHLTHDELLAHHHAVIYAVGAPGDRRLGVEGEDLPGSHAATEFVAWYNGHPDFADRRFDLSHERAVIVGNGNVALDVARILVTDPDELHRTDMADHAVEALRKSKVREVVVLGRRGPAQAAYTNPEFIALTNLDGVDIVIDPADAELDEHSRALIDSDAIEPSVRIKAELAESVAATSTTGKAKRIVFRYMASPVAVVGDECVNGLRIARNTLSAGPAGMLLATPGSETEIVETGLVLRSIGYRGNATVDLPFDDSLGIIPNEGGRVVDPATGAALKGVYTAGWIKRGPSGVIGTNKKCASDTVARILEDFENSRLDVPISSAEDLEAIVTTRNPDVLNFAGWTKIDVAEKANGELRGRPRLKFTDIESMLAAARANASD
ncbi:FAD-dependent oxidoreductase [Rhodococcus sp. NPDC059968]|uniref:FAD-dependent oxidoreductase n=1 Tax=Rhodococcus sp. NPDC059968 TaxID=3347017 RepID=UPI00366F1187